MSYSLCAYRVKSFIKSGRIKRIQGKGNKHWGSEYRSDMDVEDCRWLRFDDQRHLRQRSCNWHWVSFISESVEDETGSGYLSFKEEIFRFDLVKN